MDYYTAYENIELPLLQPMVNAKEKKANYIKTDGTSWNTVGKEISCREEDVEADSSRGFAIAKGFGY